jgi:hypothetical protein
MNASPGRDFLRRLAPAERDILRRVNRRGQEALATMLGCGEATAFLGAGASAPLYPTWSGLVESLLDEMSDVFGPAELTTLRNSASTSPEVVVDMLRAREPARFRNHLRTVFRARRDPRTGHTWTAAQELVARCNFRGVITTNYDPGIVNARMAVRPYASGTGFSSWTDDEALERWRTGDVFGDDELPVLFAHGHHNQPDALVLATSDYHRAYSAGLARLLDRLFDAQHLVWIGFGFGDQRVTAILREVDEQSGPRRAPGRDPRHVAVLPWPASSDGSFATDDDPGTWRSLTERKLGCLPLLYPVFEGNDHSALIDLLADVADPRWPDTDAPRVRRLPDTDRSVNESIVRTWVHGAALPAHFTGRAEELDRLDRWAVDPEVRLVAVTAWGGAGKTTLVTHWIAGLDGPHRARPGIRGVFAWSFYAQNSVSEWVRALVAWAEASFGIACGSGPPYDQVLTVLLAVPVVLVLDGLEVAQEAALTTDFGHLPDDTLRTVLTLACQADRAGLVVLTSRFPFADLEPFDGAGARMLDVPPLSEEEGALLLRRSGASWLSEHERRELVGAVDGHALAVGVLAAALRERPPVPDLEGLRGELARMTRTNTRVGKVLAFYADRLSSADRRLIGVVSLFQHPVAVAALRRVARQAGAESLDPWTPSEVEAAARGRLAGLLDWGPDGTVSAHPLVREAFRSYVLSGDAARSTSDVVLADLPRGPASSRDDAQRVVEMIELLLDAGETRAADDLYRTRTDDGRVWNALPAAALGLRAAQAFVGSDDRIALVTRALDRGRSGHHLNAAGVMAAYVGQTTAADRFLRAAVVDHRLRDDHANVTAVLRSLAELLCAIGDSTQAREVGSDALHHAAAGGAPGLRALVHATLARACHSDGDTADAARHLRLARPAAATVHVAGYLEIMTALTVAEVLLDLGRGGEGRHLAEQCLATCLGGGRADEIARCEIVLGRCELHDGDPEKGAAVLGRAVQHLRGGEMVSGLVGVLPDLGECCRRTGRLNEAEHLCTEAAQLAGAHHLVPAQTRALAVRGMVRGDAAASDLHRLARARDDADSALRLSTKVRRQPWGELAALRAHAHLDGLADRNGAWQARLQALSLRLRDPGDD